MSFLDLRSKFRSHNHEVFDKADKLEQSLAKGHTFDMCKELGLIMKSMRSKSTGCKTCQVSNPDGMPTRSCKEEELVFRQHFSKTMCASVEKLSDVIRKDRRDYDDTDGKDRYENVLCKDLWHELPSPSDVITVHNLLSKAGLLARISVLEKCCLLSQLILCMRIIL